MSDRLPTPDPDDYSWGPYVYPREVTVTQAELERSIPQPMLLQGDAALDFLFPGSFTIPTPEEDFLAHGHEEPLLPLAERETSIDVGLVCYGGTVCSCAAPRSMEGCGGCCADLGGCQVEEERRWTAPHVWQGDSA